MDAFMVKAVSLEMGEVLKGGKVTRVLWHLPLRLEFHIRRGDEALRLFVSADPSLPIIFASGRGKTKGDESDDFVSVMRRHLLGAVVRDVRHVPFERIVIISFLRSEPAGGRSHREMVVALTGRRSNVHLRDSVSGQMIRSLKREGRPLDEKGLQALDDLKEAERIEASLSELDSILSKDEREKETWETLFENLDGLSPTLAREAVERAERTAAETGLPLSEAVREALHSMYHAYELGSFNPTVYMKDESGSVLHVAPFELELYRDHPAKSFQSASAAAQFFYSRRVEETGLKALKGRLLSGTEAQIKKLSRRLSRLEADRERAESAEGLQRIGNLLNINFHRLKRGMKEVELMDDYDPNGRKITVAMDPRLDPRSNVELYFKRGAKAKRGHPVVKERERITRAEMSRLEALRERAQKAESMPRLEELAQEYGELSPSTPAPPVAKRKKREMRPSPPYRRYGLEDGWEIYVGKNSDGNDYVTTRLARKDDLWLHVRGSSGSHVVIRNPRKGKDVPMAVLLKAASLAAYHSKKRTSGRVPVDYTWRKNVSKPKGIGRGKVIVKEVKTLYVEPKDGPKLGLAPLLPAQGSDHSETP